MTFPRLAAAVLMLGGLVGVQLAAEPNPAGDPILIDPTGREVALKKWKVVFGVRKLACIADKPEVFEMREFGSTTFKDGVMTYVPFSRIEAIKYDYDKETASVHLAGTEKPLQGTTKYKDINMIALTAEVDQGKSGVADLRYVGGLIKGGFKEVKFPGAKAPGNATPGGHLFSFVVVPEGKGKSATVMTAHGVQGLYRMPDGTERLLPWLMFKKTLKIDIADIKKLQVTSYNVRERTAECEVVRKDDSQLSLSLLATVPLDGKTATLVGLMGTVDAGWKLFPLHTFTEMQPGEIKLEEKKDEPKKDLPKKE